MEVFKVIIENDYIERLTNTKPLNAISEAVWNA